MKLFFFLRIKWSNIGNFRRLRLIFFLFPVRTGCPDAQVAGVSGLPAGSPPGLRVGGSSGRCLEPGRLRAKFQFTPVAESPFFFSPP